MILQCKAWQYHKLRIHQDRECGTEEHMEGENIDNGEAGVAGP